MPCALFRRKSAPKARFAQLHLARSWTRTLFMLLERCSEGVFSPRISVDRAGALCYIGCRQIVLALSNS